VRHAAHDLLGRVLAGRSPGVSLSAAGLQQASDLGRTLRSAGISKVQSSPRLRAIETASAIAAHSGLDVEVRPELDEIDFGDWNGRSFESLSGEPEWERWNAKRSQARPPQGESMAEAQSRILSHLTRVRATAPGANVVMVTHAEIIRAAALHCMGLPLDAWMQVDFEPAAVVPVHWPASGGRPLVQLTGGMAAA
jgi:broad specificity phosphatase PhoE